MYKYELIIYWSSDDNAYVVEVPELPGCMADGQSYTEAVENVQSVISDWIDAAHALGREVPEPAGRAIHS